MSPAEAGAPRRAIAAIPIAPAVNAAKPNPAGIKANAPNTAVPFAIAFKPLASPSKETLSFSPFNVSSNLAPK